MKATHRPRRRRPLVATVAAAPRWGTVALLMLLLALLALVWALPARAGDLKLEVSNDAAYTGPEAGNGGQCGGSGHCGLRVRPGLSTCTAPTPNTLNITTDVSGLQEACDRITAGDPDGVTTTGTTTFKAGDEIVLRGGDDYSFTVAHSFTAVIDSSLTQWAYVQDNSPAAEKSYNASFYLKLNNLSFGNTTDDLHHLVGYSSDGTPWLQVVLRLNSGEKRLYLRARKNDGSWVTTENSTEVELPAGYNKLEINWSASAQGQQNGTFQVKLNTGEFGGPTGISNSNAQIDHIKWGAVGTHTSIDAISGTLDVDEFSSWR